MKTEFMKILSLQIALFVFTCLTAHAQETPFVKSLLSITLAEHSRYGNYKETDPKLCNQIQNYWQAVGQSNVSCSDEPWSAAFISYCVKEAGATADEFKFADAHAVFVNKAIANADKGIGVFQGVSVATYAPKLGDIIHRNRGNNTTTFEDARNGNSYISHSSILVDFGKNIFGKHAVTVGGNEHDTVRKSKVRLTKLGYIKQKRRNPYISIIKVLK